MTKFVKKERSDWVTMNIYSKEQKIKRALMPIVSDKRSAHSFNGFPAIFYAIMTVVVLRSFQQGKLSKTVTIHQFNTNLKEYCFGQNEKTHKPMPVKESILHGTPLPGKSIEKTSSFVLF